MHIMYIIKCIHIVKKGRAPPLPRICHWKEADGHPTHS